MNKQVIPLFACAFLTGAITPVRSQDVRNLFVDVRDIKAGHLSKLFAPPRGFWLRDPNRIRVSYGASAPSANWYVAQWGVKSRLEPFDSRSLATNGWQTVQIHPNGSYRLTQDTRAQPCSFTYRTGNRLVKETDLFVSPNRPIHTPGRVSAEIDVPVRLPDIRRIVHRIALRPSAYRKQSDACSVSQAVLMTAVVLTNPKSRQTLFYQLRLSSFKQAGSGPGGRFFPAGWFFTGKNVQNGLTGQYGFGDNVQHYGQDQADLGAWKAFNLDLWPRLRSLISQGARYGMAQDLSEWQLSGTYHGIAAMGHVFIASEWRGFSLAVQRK